MKIPFLSLRKNLPARSIPASPPSKQPDSPVDILIGYHEETKHHYHRFARSLGYLDWDTQPDPFRRFEGSPFHLLPLLAPSDVPSYDECFEPGRIRSQPLCLNSLSRFLRNSLAVSAWKKYGDTRWSLRVNPSSGNLHPTEAYFILGDHISEFATGLYHYAPREHGLELRARFRPEMFRGLTKDFPPGTFFAGLTSIHWREAWKYGERAYRYCQHDLGHALAALQLSALTLGWQLVLLEELSDDEVSTILGLNRSEDFEEAEDENPALIAAVLTTSSTELSSNISLSEGAIAGVSEADWYGRANRLSESHVEWEIIDSAAQNSDKPRSPIQQSVLNEQTNPVIAHAVGRDISAERIIQQRRSCLSLDGISSLSSDSFYAILRRIDPQSNHSFFRMLSRSELHIPRVHLALFVHRVEGLEPGLYFYVRNESRLNDLRDITQSSFSWTKPDRAPQDLKLYLLTPGDFTMMATGVSCGQDIAGDGAFSLGMIADFEEPIRNVGAWFYRRLFWETGIIGQILYLEAEAAGLRSTGIGCFFDDPMHELLGFRNRKFQSLYHFTVGGPLEDPRLTTEQAYTREQDVAGNSTHLFVAAKS
jgi:SagB-type dehydrogenase family enzyme